jgi:hypothetical protein
LVVAEETETPLEKPLPRKPLPESARSSLDLSRQAGFAPTGPGPVSVLPRRKPVGEITDSDSSKTSFPSTTRRPLGPRQLLSDAAIRKKALPGTENRPLGTTSQAQNTSSPQKTSIKSPRSFRGQGYDVDAVRHEAMDSCSFSITVIRRDPSSGSQWNIGVVSGQPDFNKLDQRHKGTSRHKKPYFDVSIHLETPGYTYFRKQQRPGHVKDEAASSISGDNLSADQSLPQQNHGFNRRVRMEGSSFWKRPSISHTRALSDVSAKHITKRGRSSSESSTIGTVETSPLNNDAELDSRDSQAKGYVFLSPWGGRCKFSTGSTGRSLRCKHTLPNPVSASNGGGSISTEAVTLSELRFNLPTTSVFKPASPASKKPTVDSKRFSIPKIAHTRNKLSASDIRPEATSWPHPTSYAALYPSDGEEALPLPPRNNPISFATGSTEEDERPVLLRRPHPSPYRSISASEGDESEETRLDLSIGQEKAGGGNRGKRAKLGKLIIHDEGFKMLDLVVCANMGIWWSVWESDHQ